MNPSPPEIGVFVLCLAVILGLAVTIKILLQRTPPLHREYVDRESYTKDQATIHEEFKRQAGARKDVYREIEAQGKQVSALQVEATHQTRQLHQLQTQVENIPDKIVRLLKAGQ